MARDHAAPSISRISRATLDGRAERGGSVAPDTATVAGFRNRRTARGARRGSDRRWGVRAHVRSRGVPARRHCARIRGVEHRARRRLDRGRAVLRVRHGDGSVARGERVGAALAVRPRRGGARRRGAARARRRHAHPPVRARVRRPRAAACALRAHPLQRPVHAIPRRLHRREPGHQRRRRSAVAAHPRRRRDRCRDRARAGAARAGPSPAAETAPVPLTVERSADGTGNDDAMPVWFWVGLGVLVLAGVGGAVWRGRARAQHPATVA